MAMTIPAEGTPEPLKYQTWVLKVSIHCEGCKKKVKKVLQGIDGVYMTTIDSQRHKVTVTGNVDAETLVKKLTKTGKYAELWPETLDKNPEKSKKKKNKGKQNDTKTDETAGGDDQKSSESNEEDAGDQSPTTYKKDSEKEEINPGDKNSGGGKKKKKKNKGQNGNSIKEGGEHIGNGPPTAATLGPAPATATDDFSLPHQHGYPYPPPVYPLYPPPAQVYNYPVPEYTASFNRVAYPSANANVMYDGPPIYGHTDMYSPASPSDSINTYDDDSDEVGCSIM